MARQMSSSELYERGLVFKQLRMFHPAIENFQKAARDPQHAGKAYVQMALCLKAVGRHEAAVMAFQQALASPSLSAEEQRHILYHIGLTLESLDRQAECLAVYGRIRNEDPGFRDVARRIKYLSSGKRGSVPPAQGSWQTWKKVLNNNWTLKPQMAAFFEQTGRWLGWQVERNQGRSTLPSDRFGAGIESVQGEHSDRPTQPRIQPILRKRTVEHRRHARVAVCLQSHFTVKGRMVSGKGELRDLSPWGCRVTSTVAVPVGTDLQCRIFPHGSGDAFIIEGATVRWISPKEFGLAFTDVQPSVQQQIVELCRTAA